MRQIPEHPADTLNRQLPPQLEAANERLLRIEDVMSTTGLRRSVIYKWMETGDFPKNISIGKKYIAWLESEVQAWIAKHARARAKAGELVNA